LAKITDESYVLGVYYPSTTVNVTFFNITISGINCTTGQIYNGVNCAAPINLVNNVPQTRNITVGEPLFFQVNVNPLVTNFTVSATPTNLSVNVNVYLRYGSGPSISTNDAFGTNGATVSVPRSGFWYVMVDYPMGPVTTVNVTASSKTCPTHGTVGPFCNITIDNPDVTLLTLRDLPAQTWQYFNVTSMQPGNPLWVSVAPDTGRVMPQVYVLQNSIPTTSSYDFSGCNQPACNATTIINLNSTQNTPGNYTFIVGVYSPINNTRFGIWFNTVCSPLCEQFDQGECTYAGDNVGYCACVTNYIGIDCTVDASTGLLPQYIVLIIIASLVVASAIIGFIAWAYMQKKRQGYQAVKD